MSALRREAKNNLPKLLTWRSPARRCDHRRGKVSRRSSPAVQGRAARSSVVGEEHRDPRAGPIRSALLIRKCATDIELSTRCWCRSSRPTSTVGEASQIRVPDQPLGIGRRPRPGAPVGSAGSSAPSAARRADRPLARGPPGPGCADADDHLAARRMLRSSSTPLCAADALTRLSERLGTTLATFDKRLVTAAVDLRAALDLDPFSRTTFSTASP